MKQRRGVGVTLFEIDNSKYLFLENAETVTCANILSPNDALDRAKIELFVK